MITYGCPKDQQAELARRLRRIVELTGLPVRVGCHRGAGVFVEWTVRGRGKETDRQRSATHWALMDAEAVLGLRARGSFASACRTCGATCANYDHAPAFCAALVALATEFAVPIKIVPARCGECSREYTVPRDRLLPGLCEECYARAIAEAAAGDEAQRWPRRLLS
jgi:hypothetical protein